MDTLRIAGIEEHPVYELFPCRKKYSYVGLKIVANSKMGKKFLKCELCNRFFMVGQQISFLVAYTDGKELGAQFAHHKCIEEYQSKIKKE